MKQHQIEWREVELGNESYFKIVSSGINTFDGEKDYLSTESIKRTKIEKVESKITYENRPSRANMQPIFNSVWFAKMQSTLKVYAFTKDNKKEIGQYILSTGFAGIQILNKEISPDYIRVYLATEMFNSEKDKLSTGSTQKGINNSLIIKMKIPLPFSNGSPDLKEQERIVKILEDSEKLNERGKRAEELLDEYLKSVFYEMFLKDKDKFEIEKLGDICDVRDGTHESPKYVNEGYPLITSKNITKGYIDFSEVNLISKKDFDSVNKRSKIDVGNIIMPMIGTIGKPIIVPKTKEFAIKNVALIKFTKIEINNIYIKFLLDSDYFYYLTFMINRGGTQKFIALKDIRSFEIPLPPLPLQQKFASIVEQVEKMKDSVNKTKQNSEELFNSLVSKGFRGELGR